MSKSEFKIEKVSIEKLVMNPENPRTITETKFNKLVKSIQEFPEMLKIRPIVVDENMMVLGGNMRLKACEEAGLSEVYIIKAKDLTKEQKDEFIIKDNVGFGEWDFSMLANLFDDTKLIEWGLDVPNTEGLVDYSILDEGNLDDQMKGMSDGVKKAVQIEFNIEHFEEASELIKFWREKGLYIGGFLIEALKAEKEKIQ